jgi:DNA-binding response OmpR family regulator
VRSGGTLLEGLRELEEFRPDVMLLDLALADGDGMTLLTEVRERLALAVVKLLIDQTAPGADEVVPGFRTGG